MVLSHYWLSSWLKTVSVCYACWVKGAELVGQVGLVRLLLALVQHLEQLNHATRVVTTTAPNNFFKWLHQILQVRLWLLLPDDYLVLLLKQGWPVFLHVSIPRLSLAEIVGLRSFTFIYGRWLLDCMRTRLRRHKIDTKHIAQQCAGKNHHVLEIPLSFLTLLEFRSKKLLILLQLLNQKMVFIGKLVILHQRLVNNSF